MLLKYLNEHWREFIAALIATIALVLHGVLATNDLFDNLSTVLSGGHISLDSKFLVTYVFMGLFCAVILLSYYLLKIKRPIVSAVSGLMVSYILVSWTDPLIPTNLTIRLILFIVVYFIFFIAIQIFRKIKVKAWIVIGVSMLLVAISSHFSLYLYAWSRNKTIQSNDTSAFQSAIKNPTFVAYYPTYQSPTLPATPAKLNGYLKTALFAQTVTFNIGNAQAEESIKFTNQDQVMDFDHNCDILAISSTMEKDTTISGYDIQTGIDHPQKCDLAATTPSGKNVYQTKLGDNMYFYVLMDNTNFLLTYSTYGPYKYDPAQLPEILKIIDSLQPLSADKLGKGGDGPPLQSY